MTQGTVVSWQEIPSMVEARNGRDRHKVQLSERFQELIDMIAMRRGLDGTDEYLAEWRKNPSEARVGSARDVAEAMAQELEDRYEEIRAAAVASIKS